jgi:hypothetical protein
MDGLRGANLDTRIFLAVAAIDWHSIAFVDHLYEHVRAAVMLALAGHLA